MKQNLNYTLKSIYGTRLILAHENAPEKEEGHKKWIKKL